MRGHPGDHRDGSGPGGQRADPASVANTERQCTQPWDDSRGLGRSLRGGCSALFGSGTQALCRDGPAM